jgi:hypothetical protein
VIGWSFAASQLARVIRRDGACAPVCDRFGLTTVDVEVGETASMFLPPSLVIRHGMFKTRL